MLVKEQAQEIRDVIALELQKIGRKYGFQIHLGKLTYGPNEFRVRVSGDRAAEKPSFVAPIFNERMAIGRKFRIRKRCYEVINVIPGARKFTLLASRLPDGKRFKVTLKQVSDGAY